MAALELDPLFVKGLKLLHSKSKDSTDQLKQLVDDLIAQRKGESVKKEVKESEKSSARQTVKVEEEKRREAEKRSFEKVKQDLSELSSQGKKPRQDSSKDVKDESKKSKDKERVREKDREREKEKERERREKELREKEKREAEKKELEKKVKSEVVELSSDTEEEKGLDDFAFGLGTACVVCSLLEVQSGNSLVECQECHNLYHQDCHRPPVTDQQVNDPRSVWYCSRCAKTLQKMVAKPTKPKPSSVSGMKEPVNINKPIKNESTALFPFRRTEALKPNSSRESSSSAAKPLSGLASLAANLSAKGTGESNKSKSDNVRHNSVKSESSKSITKGDVSRPLSGNKSDQSDRSVTSSSKLKSSSGSAKPSNSGGAASVLNADKRLQMMMKKAAAKQKSGLK